MGVDIRDLRIAIGGKEIVHGVDLSIGDGERVGLIGSSGSGKSMIARAMLGLLPPDVMVTGSVMLGGAEVIGAADRTLADLRGRYTGMVFQNPGASLNPVLPVGRQIELPLRLHYDLTRAERIERVNAMLAKVGLPADVAAKFPHELSGGQRQRVGIATALITSPRLIVADEPTTALDSITQRQIVDLLVSLVDEAGASMLFITHDFSVLARATTRCVVLDEGSVAETGETATMLAAPQDERTARLVRAARTLTLRVSREGADRETDRGAAPSDDATADEHEGEA
ncbi:ABC transporter, ATP-binding protein [Bifidobacterium pullorum subsp. saeculare DSM 6531 = LMG 14934]|uniref:ABC transporter, ATP-binding protein n=2 Tax=Bifidobacterium pullorum TaxID=78448 RepID=A0A087D118_9BIFI|nr:ABC transporter ATP-binding protein [Bifidobacterium pullorum]KFI83565.1 dipeptide/oligopeptide/nickel ABC transporter ATPase [Bifidobacterium pullorum]KFI89218.1 ABC transporter, ATP-binding protein [Bifidobacterium pullorum subsp. saeculare DSM 6531 = LMG 14934]